jgi:hypothetical protein
MATLEDKSIWEDGEDSLGEEVLRMSTDEIASRARLLDNGEFHPAFIHTGAPFIPILSHPRNQNHEVRRDANQPRAANPKREDQRQHGKD